FNWGFNEWMMKKGATEEDPHILAGKVIIIKIILGAVWGLGLWFVLRAIRPELYLGYVLLLAILDVWLDSIFGTIIVIFLLTNRVKLGSLFLTSSRVIRLILGLVLIFFVTNSIYPVLIFRTAGTLVLVIVSWVCARPIIPFTNIKKLWRIFFDSSAFNLSELLNLIYLYTDVNILSLLGSDPQLIGRYSIVLNLINAIIMLPLGMYNVLLPNLVNSYNNKLTSFSKQLRLIYIIFTALGLTLWAGAALLSKPVITSLLGEKYNTSIEFLTKLAPLLALRTLNQANSAYLISVGWQGKRLIPQSVITILKILIGLLLVTRLGVNGIIIASIGTEALLAIGYLFLILQRNTQYKEHYK
ncbi:MAG: hypothetical protein SVR94_17670, partial [Pseudomonadota bacterium]|nr:hypothetical protein [Pseudomonadota bacterium]